jgi:hypothetical protein
MGTFLGVFLGVSPNEEFVAAWKKFRVNKARAQQQRARRSR